MGGGRGREGGRERGREGGQRKGKGHGRSSMFVRSLLSVFMRDGGGAGPPVGLYQVVTLVCTLK